MGVKATVEAGTRRDDFAPASIPVAQHICGACGTHYTGRPDSHTCGEISAEAQEMATTAVLTPTGFARLGHGHPGSKKAVENELDAVMLAIRMFHVKQPDQVLRECAAYTARLSELMVMAGQGRVHLTGVEYALDDINTAIDDLHHARMKGRGVIIP